MTVVAEEGVRRSICDMSLLIFHLILSSFTFEGVDVSIAQQILDFNQQRYPNGMASLPLSSRVRFIALNSISPSL